jgi:penicillin-binding protein 1C
LWNRIMLHLHETNEPAAFSPPVGYVLVPICATTGHRPQPGCGAVVSEWIRPSDQGAWQRPAPAAPSRDEDFWLAQQPNARIAGLRIAFPRNGDTFVYSAGVSAADRASQRIELRAVGDGHPIRWKDGIAEIPLDSQGSAFWQLRLGTWTLHASDGSHDDAVTIHVIAPPHGSHPGFSFSSR